MEDNRIQYSGKLRIDRSEQGTCYLCNKPATIKIGIWSRLKVMSYSDEMGWRELLLCDSCNDKEKCTDFEKVWEHIGY